MKRKYRLLFTPKSRGKPGPKGPSPELVSAILEMKRRNPSFGYQRIADQISLIFDIEVEKDVVRRVLARHYRPECGLLSMRIADPQVSLGDGCYGSI